MKKIGGLTWWRNNYGSILQAYALQQMINSYDGVEYELINQYSVKIASVENLVLKIKENGIINTVKRFIFRFGVRKLRKRVESIERFVSGRLIVSQRIYNEKTIKESNANYDAFICGSDQIWNPANVPLNSIYWLAFTENNKKRFSYAASIGINTADKDQSSIIRQNLMNYDGISCREDDGSSLINQIMGKDICKTVLDPTLMVNDEVWNELSEKRVVESPYIFAYMLRGTKADRKLIERFAKAKQLRIVTIPFLDAENIKLYDLKFGDFKKWDASPSDFISLIRYAEYIFTDSFHCMIFSIRYQKTFFMFRKLGKAQMSRILGLQDKLKTGNRMINSQMTTTEIEGISEIKWDEVSVALENERFVSKQYLDSIVSTVKDA